MHIAPYDNRNNPIVDAENGTVPLNYFNIVKLKNGEAFEYQVPGYETCIVPATGTVHVEEEDVAFGTLGTRDGGGFALRGGGRHVSPSGTTLMAS